MPEQKIYNELDGHGECPENLQRVCVPALDEILGVPYKVLDKGFVRCVDYMGDESGICQAARVSYGKGTKSISEDSGLLRYLLRHSHTTPFESIGIKFHVRIPMDAWRQGVRHRMASINEYSTRYSEAIDDKQETAPDQWRLQAATNKQGSDGTLKKWPDKGDLTDYEQSFATPGEYLSKQEFEFHQAAADLYAERLKYGVAKEVARKDLPLSTYTELYWTWDLHNLLHFLSLRMDKHAQLEIRSYANVIGDIVAKWVPNVWQAFNEYNFRRDALLLTARDSTIVKLATRHAYNCHFDGMAEGRDEEAMIKAAESFGWLERDEKTGKIKGNRERAECEVKLEKLGLDVPWRELLK